MQSIRNRLYTTSRTTLFAVAVVILFSSSVLAQKITVDPNAPGSQPAQRAVTGTDTRLAQKVTYEAKRKTVSAILSDLSEMTGVALKAGYNNQDWQVRDRKMNIFATDVPLSDLMNSIAHVMKFKWEINNKDNIQTYRLYMDRKTLLDADAQKARRDAYQLELRTQRRNRVIEDFINATSLSKKDLASMKSERPYLYMLASTGMAGGIGRLIQAFPAVGEAIATGQELAIPASQLPPEAKQGLNEYIEGLNNFVHKDPNRKGDIHVELDKATLNINGRIIEYPTMAAIGFNFIGGGGFGTTLIDPDSKLAQAVGKAYVDIEDGKGGSFNDVNSGSSPEMQRAGVSDMEAFDPGEPLIEHPDDPALLKKIKVEPMSNLLVDVSAALAKSSGFAVVSDCFDQINCSYLRTGEVEIRALLDGIAKSCHYNWEKSGSIIEFRDRSWFVKRSAQIPESRIKGWRKALEKNETLSIDELAQIATLTQEQIKVNITNDEIMSRTEPFIETLIWLGQDFFRAYNALTKSEREMIFSPSGLVVGEVSADRLALVRKPIGRANANYMTNQNAQITLRGERAQQGKLFQYTITAASDGLEPINWRITTPKYEPPKDTKPLTEAK